MENCVVSLIFVFIAVFIIWLSGFCCIHKRKIDRFVGDVYGDVRTKLTDMKLSHGIGEAPGILVVEPTGSDEECDTTKNQLVQSNVAFRQSTADGGCTYVDKVWPGSS